jgi:hypothetical protein
MFLATVFCGLFCSQVNALLLPLMTATFNVLHNAFAILCVEFRGVNKMLNFIRKLKDKSCFRISAFKRSKHFVLLCLLVENLCYYVC